MSNIEESPPMKFGMSELLFRSNWPPSQGGYTFRVSDWVEKKEIAVECSVLNICYSFDVGRSMFNVGRSSSKPVLESTEPLVSVRSGLWAGGGFCNYEIR